MSLVKIEIRSGKTEEYKKTLFNGVHDALVWAIKIPEYDRFQRLYELEPAYFEAPPNKTGASGKWGRFLLVRKNM